MAIELCSENSSVVMSPRISFSHDLSQMDTVPVEQYIRSSSPSSSIDFDFCVFRESLDQESSSAEELFFDGKILPIEIKRRLLPPPKKAEPPLSPPPQPQLPPPRRRQRPLSHKADRNINAKKNLKNENPEAAKRVVSESSSDDQKQNSNKSFWRFKRSTSLNCGSGYARSLCPLPLLSRSNSTGSAPSVKRSSFSKDNYNLSHNKQHSQKHFYSVASMKQSQYSSAANVGHHQKPPLKKNYMNGSQHCNRVKINPVLNVPTASLFGLGSMFSSTTAKEKNKKK